MFIVDVTDSWSKRLGIEKELYLTDQGLLQKLQQMGYKDVHIDTAKTKILKSKQKAPAKISEKKSSIQEKLSNAANVHKKTYKAVTSIMSDFKRSGKIRLGNIQEVVSDVVDCVLENKYIITGLGMMQSNNNALFEHAVNSLTLMVAFANSLAYDYEKQTELGTGALLHDIGMLEVPSNILNKRSKLLPDEMIEMRKHVKQGYEILKNIPGIPQSTLLMASQHHERINGSGYPLKLKGDKISEYGQMAGIIDVYHAATSDRGYRKGISPSQALAEILLKKNDMFNVELVGKFVKAIGIYPFGSLLKLKNGLAGIVVNIEEEDLLHPTMRIIYDQQKGGLIRPYDIYPGNYKKDSNYKIMGVKPIEELFLKKADISKYLGVQY